MIELTAYRGDSMSFTIPLTNGTAAFTPGGSYSLIFTAKRSSKDPDTAAVFQKSTATGTITTSTTNAIVTVLYIDTTTEDEPVLYWDIQAQHNSTAAVITAAKGTLTLVRDITRQTTASVPIYTVDPAAGGGGATPAGSDGSVQINNSGALAADSGLVYTGTGNTGVLKIGGGSVIMSDPTVSQNVAIGGGNPTLPFANRTTGNYNTSIGTGNLPLLTTGNKNVAIGTSTLANVTTGSENFGFGVNTLFNLTSGTNNIAIGTGVAPNITTGADNICIGGSPLGADNVSSISIGSTGDGSSKTVIGVGGNAPNTQTRLVGNTLILGHASTTTSRTSLVQSASASAKTITLPNATGTVPVYTGAPSGTGKVLTSSGVLGAATWEDPTAVGVTSITAGTGLSGGTITTTGTIALANTSVTAQSYTNADITVDAQGRITAAANGSAAGTVTGTAPIVVTSGVVSLSTTLPSAYAFTSTTRPTSSATTATLAAADAQSLITKGDGDSRFIRNNVTTLPTATYTSSSGQNQAWINELWIIPAQTNGLSPTNTAAGFIVNGFFVAHNSGIGKSLQIFPALTIGANNSIAGTITDGGVFNSTFVFNVGGGAVDLLANVVSSRMKLSGSGVASQYFRYRFATNFAANAGDIIVMSPSGHTFVVDTTITNATVFTNASTGGVTVRSVTGGSSPTTADTSLTVNGGASISTTYQINSATNTGVHPSGLLFISSTGIHLLSTQYGANGAFRLSGIY